MISKTYGTFFKKLSKNNTKEWFHNNKKQYENEVKAPFLKLAEEMLQTLTVWDARIPSDVKKALFRINRDIRFSKDKSPYNLIMKAGFSPHGRKSKLPGYYLGIDAEHVHVGGGLFMISTPELKKVRYHIASKTDTFLNIIENQDFKNSFSRLKGEKAKRLDKDLLQVAAKTEYLFYKQFYAFSEFPLADFYGPNGLAEEILEHFKAIRPLNEFLEQPLHA